MQLTKLPSYRCGTIRAGQCSLHYWRLIDGLGRKYCGLSGGEVLDFLWTENEIRASFRGSRSVLFSRQRALFTLIPTSAVPMMDKEDQTRMRRRTMKAMRNKTMAKIKHAKAMRKKAMATEPFKFLAQLLHNRNVAMRKAVRRAKDAKPMKRMRAMKAMKGKRSV